MRWCAAHEAFGPQPLCRLGLASFSKHFFRRLRRGVNRMSLQVRGDVARLGFESRNVRRRGAGVLLEVRPDVLQLRVQLGVLRPEGLRLLQRCLQLHAVAGDAFVELVDALLQLPARLLVVEGIESELQQRVLVGRRAVAAASARGRTAVRCPRRGRGWRGR